MPPSANLLWRFIMPVFSYYPMGELKYIFLPGLGATPWALGRLFFTELYPSAGFFEAYVNKVPNL